MKPKGLFIAAAVLLVLAGGIFFSNKQQAAKEKAPAANANPKIVSIPEDQFQEIRIQKTTGDTVDLKKENGKWTMTAPKALPADSDSVTSLVSTLSNVSTDATIEDKATDLTPYGLAKPAMQVQITPKSGKTVTLEIGDDTPTSSGAYAKLAADPHVYTIGSFVKSSIDKKPDDLRDKRLLTFDQDKLTRVELAAKGQPVEFGKNNNNEWTILKPKPLRADGSSVDTLISKLKDAKMDLTTEPAEAAKKFAGATKVATATVTDAGGPQTLEVRKDKDNNYYAKSSVVEGVYKIPTDVGDGLNKTLDDFRNKKLFDFGFSDPTKLEVKGATYTKSGDKWTSGAKTMDNTAVQNLIDKLRDLTATKFAETGGGQPVFDATVTSNNGKRVEKVTITKQGDKYFAQREGEPSIYELDGKSVEDLQKSASDVKEAAPPPAAPKKK
ncbi:MAG TPA: DUF4340 domain-containing protein [Bryobacteraceae bacterium]|nr:DUF4340 domain-containing protein [Bryobacteraceae bacterium]